MALEAAQHGKDLSEIEFYLCAVWDQFEFGRPSEACPTCGTKPDKFVLI